MRKNSGKRVAAILTGMILTLSLTACGSQNGGNHTGGSSAEEDRQGENLTAEAGQDPSVQTNEEQKKEENPAEETVQAEEDNNETAGEETTQATDGGKTLVVYYSATGHTEGVAGYIAAATDADIFELEPAEPYSSEDLDWTNENSRVSQEHENPESRNVELVTATVDDWESYDTVFIGYPIWWHIAAWPVDGFIAANDFTGKTVIPFCTSSSSDLGESGELLAEAAGTGNWLEGARFSSSASEEAVQEWVDSLGLQ